MPLMPQIGSRWLLEHEQPMLQVEVRFASISNSSNSELKSYRMSNPLYRCSIYNGQVPEIRNLFHEWMREYQSSMRKMPTV